MGGNEHEPVSARALGMGKSCLLLPDCWALINNIGALKYDSGKVEAGICSGSNWSGQLPGTSAITAGKALGKGINAGFGVMRSGSLLYNETRIITGASHKINWMQLGIAGTYLINQTKDLASKSTFILEAGGVAQFKNLKMGMHLYNPTGSYIGTERYRAIVPPGIRAGMAYSIAGEKLLLSGEYCKALNIKGALRLGIEYRLDSTFIARAGLETGTGIASAGIGIQGKRISIDIAGQNHPVLGIAITLSAAIKITRLKEIIGPTSSGTDAIQ